MDKFRIAGIIFLIIAVAFAIAAAVTGNGVFIGAAIFCGVVGILLLIFGARLAGVFGLANVPR
jgi:hypothetical protein